MCVIMDEIQEHVPAKTTVSYYNIEDEEVEDNDEEMKAFIGETFHQILLGGDQLTAARCHGSAAAHSDSDTRRQRLHGLIPVSEDWHAKFRLCKVRIFYLLYNYPIVFQVIHQKLFGSSFRTHEESKSTTA